MRKKFLVVLLSFAVFLSGCFGGSDEKKDEGKKIEGFHSYETEEFRTQVPDGWETLTAQNFPSHIAKNTLAAFRNNVRNASFTANAVIQKNEFASETSRPSRSEAKQLMSPEGESLEISREDYSKALAEKLKDSLSSYREIQIEPPFYHVEGRERPDADLKKFMQISFVREKTAYSVLSSYLATEKEDLAKKIETVVREFEVK
jgi:hypothetical protein